MFGPNSQIPLRSTAVACAVLRQTSNETEVLVMRRTLKPLDGVWSLVTGHVDEGESAWRAAYREVEEETGLTPLALYTANFCDQWYNHRVNVIEIVPMFVAYVDSEHNISLNEEHSEYKWLSVMDSISLIPFHGHKTALEHIRHTFIDNTPPEWLKVELGGSS